MLLRLTSKLFYSFILITLMISTTGFAQSTSYLDSLDGKFALQFQITENFSLSDFQGAILSGKYHFSKRDAIRLGFSLIADNSDAESGTNRIDTTNFVTLERERNSFGFTLNTQYIRYLRGTDDISFFAGGGPSFSYQTSTTETKPNNLVNEEGARKTTDYYILGLDVLLGVEWWFHKYMSLSAEYGMKFYYRTFNSKEEIGAVINKVEEDYLKLSANNIRFGITVYF